MKFCPDCGAPFTQGDRFCQQCGFDASALNAAKEVKNTAPAPASPAYAPSRTAAPAGATGSGAAKKPLLLLLFVVLGVGTLGTGGYYAYRTIAERRAEKEKAIAVTSDSAAAETQESLMDQALKSAKKQAAPKPTANPTGNDNMAVALLEVGRYDEPKYKNPKSPAKLMLQKKTMIVRITTDHYNDGMGAAIVGTISIKDRDGNVLGTYNAAGRKGKNGTPAGKWVATPHLVLDKGTYFIWDSEFATWSKNFVGNGFVLVEGYPVQ